jgi:hypothetical protein
MTEKITPDAAVRKGPQATPNLPTAKAGQVLAPSSVQPRQQRNDCVGMVLSLRPAADLLTELLKTAKKGGTTNFQLKPIPKEFKDCNEAVGWFNATALQGSFAATTKPVLKFSSPEIRTAQRPDKSWEAKTKVSWSVNSKETIIRLPDWTNVKRKADRDAWGDAVKALKAHEVLHVRIAEEYAKKLPCTLSATGGSKSKAVESLRAEVKEGSRYRVEVKRLLDDLGAEYDRVTAHGRNQSKIGGKDVLLVCPPPAP